MYGSNFHDFLLETGSSETDILRKASPRPFNTEGCVKKGVFTVYSVYEHSPARPWRPDPTNGLVDFKSTRLDWRIEIPENLNMHTIRSNWIWSGESNWQPLIRMSWSKLFAHTKFNVSAIAYLCTTCHFDFDSLTIMYLILVRRKPNNSYSTSSVFTCCWK